MKDKDLPTTLNGKKGMFLFEGADGVWIPGEIYAVEDKRFILHNNDKQRGNESPDMRGWKYSRQSGDSYNHVVLDFVLDGTGPKLDFPTS